MKYLLETRRITAMKYLFTLFAALSLIACSDDPAGPDLGQQQFAYTAFTLEGDEILQGVMELTTSASDTVAGSWEIDWVEGADQRVLVGPQIGEGALVGMRSGSTITIDLNPGNADFNVVLYGTWEGKRISGEWEFTGIAGPMYQGTFELRGTSGQ
ncbi:hypothetical protein ACFL4Y_03620 [Gemmatimonadota bacterium]